MFADRAEESSILNDIYLWTNIKHIKNISFDFWFKSISDSSIKIVCTKRKNCLFVWLPICAFDIFWTIIHCQTVRVKLIFFNGFLILYFLFPAKYSHKPFHIHIIHMSYKILTSVTCFFLTKYIFVFHSWIDLGSQTYYIQTIMRSNEYFISNKNRRSSFRSCQKSF